MARADGAAVCPFCQGAWLGTSELELLSPGASAALALETRDDSAGFAKVRCCPECGAVMAPWRLQKLEAWVERCPGCERYWAEKQDLVTLQMIGKRQARAQAVASMSERERKELASGLAEAVGRDPDEEPELSGVQYALMVIGIPSVTRVSGNKVPWATWSFALACVMVFLAGRLYPEDFGPMQLAFDPGRGDALGLFTATFAHFGWLHLLVNVGFLVTFGDGAEQRVQSWALAVAFVFLAPLFTWIEAAVTGTDQLIGGASGAVAMVTAACVVLQPKAKVSFLVLGRIPAHLPIAVFGLFQLATQLGMAAIGVPGTAWWAHLSGIAAGVIAGFAVKWMQAPGVPLARA